MKQSESEVLGKQNSFVPMKRSQSGDRISQLPDAILCHILSFVPFKQSVQTSILSKRWFPVWKYLPVIDVDDSTLLLEPIAVTGHSVHSSFIKFMSNVFNHCHEAPICKFVLQCSKFDVFLVNQWIIAAVKRRIQELDLCITMGKKFKISAGLFAYQELVTLKLGNSFVLDVPGSLVFPNLRELHLDGIEFDDDNIHKFLSGCPVLEGLHIIDCPSEKWDTLVIKVPALKFLTVDIASYNDDTDSHDNQFKFILDTPNLELLNYSGCEPFNGFCFGILDSLVEAILDIITYEDETENAIEIVRSIVNAKIVCLTDKTLELLTFRDAWDVNWPVFHNVTELRLGLSNSCCGRLFNKLLHNSPNLEVLVLDSDLVPCRKNEFTWERPSRVPYCMTRHLKVVNIWGYDERMCVGEFIKYVLRNARVLKECSSNPYKSMVREAKREGVKLNDHLLHYLIRFCD